MMNLLECNRQLKERLRNIEDGATIPSPQTASEEYLDLSSVDLLESSSSINSTSSSFPSNDPTSLKFINESGSSDPLFPGVNFNVMGIPDTNGWSPSSSSLASLTVGYDDSTPSLDYLYYLRLTFLEHNLQLGITLTQDKVDALLVGDLSGQVVHPILVHISHLWGFAFTQVDRISLSSQEEYYLQTVLDMLSNLSADQDFLVYIQAHCQVAVYFYFKIKIDTGRKLLVKAIKALEHYGLGTFLANGPVGINLRTLGFFRVALDDSEERRNAVLHLFYIDRVLEVLLRFPSLLPGTLSEELEKLTMRQMPFYTSSSIPVIRAMSMSLFHSCQRAMQGFILENTSLETWFTEHGDTVCRLQCLFLSIKGTLDSKHGLVSSSAHGYDVALKYCAVICASGLTSIFSFFSNLNHEWGHQCLHYAIEVVSITSSLTDDDFDFLDASMLHCSIFAINYESAKNVIMHYKRIAAYSR
ncbi:hypothetical protein D9758_010005 [Tetrapyrgos nigripes]|uniref:Uncharacterized protein n=1 Tax=Tetrapyrgos nigripes TaxID=182062 RepID=A0A8H5FTC9_9AGAR|nr:hypothetical protein D9758_010005 [Tetrapyrgos nigripes]